MLKRLIVPLLIFSLCGFPLNSFAGTERPEGDSSAGTPSSTSSQIFRAEVSVDSQSGKVVGPGQGDAQGHLVAIEVTDPLQLGDAVNAVATEMEAVEHRAGATSDGIDEMAVLTHGDDSSIEVKQQVAHSRPAKIRSLIYQPLAHLGAWWELNQFRVTVVGTMSLIAGGATYFQMIISDNPLEAAVAHWIAPYVAGILMLVEWQNLRMKNFVTKGKGVMARLYDLFTWNAQQITSETKAYKFFRMFANNTEINLGLFTVFKFLLLTTISVKSHQTIDEAIDALPGSFRLAYVFSIIGSSLVGTMVAFPTSQAIYHTYDEELKLAGVDPVLVKRANNQFQFKTSGALALRALCMTAIILGVHEIVAGGGVDVVPATAVGAGLFGMGTMFKISLSVLQKQARNRVCGVEIAAQDSLTHYKE